MMELKKGLLILLLCCTLVNSYPVRRWIYTEKFENTNYHFGFELGATFSKEIKTRLEEDTDMKQLVDEFGGATGNPLYSHFIAEHEKTFPNYMDELRGIANGSGVDFDIIFIGQLKQEFTYYLKESNKEIKNNSLVEDDHCSDLVLFDESGNVIIAHNEDAGLYDVNGTVLVEAPNGVNGGPAFTALVYLGQTPTNAFGFNENGIIFTMNKVSPKFSDPRGVGRVFIGRSILDATSFDDAINKATNEFPMIAGHNYQIGLSGTNQVVNIEVASFGEYKITEINPGSEVFFHANMYTMMDIPQILPNPSSEHRIARFEEIHASQPIQTAKDMLNVIGDQADKEYPIYHDTKSHSNGDLSGYTLVSVLINLRTCEMLFYENNPKFHNYSFKLTICFSEPIIGLIH